MARNTGKPKAVETIWILDGSFAEASRLGKCLRHLYSLRVFVLFRDLEKALQEETKKPALLLSEISFPDGSLPDFLQSSHCSIPPLMIVSSCNTRAGIDQCLKMQVEDYFIKPVDPNLLSAKIDRFFELRAMEKKRAAIGLQLDRFSLEMRTKKLTVTLTHKEFQILSLLYHAYPEGVRRSQLVQEIWKNISVVSRTFDVHLFHVRQKLETLGYGIEFANLCYSLVLPRE